MIAPSTKLGAYQIVSTLGAGGMGEVWLARDTRLGREVAIKVLPSSLAIDPDRLARFDREARVLASLNHANSISSAGGEPAPIKGAEGLISAPVLDDEWIMASAAEAPRPVCPKSWRCRSKPDSRILFSNAELRSGT